MPLARQVKHQSSASCAVNLLDDSCCSLVYYFWLELSEIPSADSFASPIVQVKYLFYQPVRSIECFMDTMNDGFM